jgi:phage/plasmid-like protein (TIGR03299 family)
MSTIAQFTSVRVVCRNTLQQAMKDATGRVTIPHVKDFDSDLVKTQLGIGEAQWDAFTKGLDVIAKLKVDSALATKVMDKVFQLPEDFEKRMQDSNRVHAVNVVDMFTHRRYIGADVAGDTGWGLVNALTEYVDFRKKARNPSNRLNSAWFGEGATLKQRAVNETLALAA